MNMKRIFLSVATLMLVTGAIAFGDTPKVSRINIADAWVSAMQDTSQTPPELKTFTGTIAKSGEQFVLREESSKSLLQLDDQQSAEKFAGKRVRVIGVLDDSNNTIRVQSIEEANA
jgi:hypothetical protein